MIRLWRILSVCEQRRFTATMEEMPLLQFTCDGGISRRYRVAHGCLTVPVTGPHVTAHVL